MKSPFPGMDPYIEECKLFEDFHNNLVSKIHDELAERVPDRYIVRTGERPYIVISDRDGKVEHVFVPDIGVVSPRDAQNPVAHQGSVAIAEPASDVDFISMQAFVSAEYRETFVEIYLSEPDRTLVTCIEVLSPSNKRYGTPGWNIYLRKRQGMLMGMANFVEIDLLRRGDKMPMLDPWPNSPYSLLMARKLFAPHCRVWPAHYRRPIPALPIPLSHPDADVMLNLQPLIDGVYARSRYDRDIDYTRPLTPPLSAEDNAWLAEQVRQRV
ncbi:MAG: DUF4058 family protein [Planctomycetes bacterium]|nr:DUF4058 family protein [Planctomycetota bacterium]